MTFRKAEGTDTEETMEKAPFGLCGQRSPVLLLYYLVATPWKAQDPPEQGLQTQ